MAELTSKLVGEEYRLGKHDCLSVIIYFCEAWGIELPDEFEGYTRDNYAELYNIDNEKAIDAFARFISTLGEEVPPDRLATGDFILAEYAGKKGIFVHGGSGVGICAFADKGISATILKPYTVLKAYRWREN